MSKGKFAHMVERSSLDYRAERGIQASANFRVIMVSVVAAVIGILAGFIAYILYNLIGFFTNLFFYQRLSFDLTSIKENHLGLLVIGVTVLGGIIVGVMAKYGSPK